MLITLISNFTITGCNTVIYEPSVSTLPFRLCDQRNQGVSLFCNLENEQARIYTVSSYFADLVSKILF
jgi:hypothetical protein